jgi:hypothetical protein
MKHGNFVALTKRNLSGELFRFAFWVGWDREFNAGSIGGMETQFAEIPFAFFLLGPECECAVAVAAVEGKLQIGIALSSTTDHAAADRPTWFNGQTYLSCDLGRSLCDVDALVCGGTFETAAAEQEEHAEEYKGKERNGREYERVAQPF